MAQATKLPFGTALALAQRTLTAPLAAVLSTENLDMREWFTLNALGLRGSIRMEVITDLLATNGLDASAARNLVAGMENSGLIETRDSVVSLTQAGATRYTSLRERINQVTTRIFDQFDAERVETARSLLQEIADINPEDLTRRSVLAS
ncbi:MarR family winged helix-turn-helix transcriptional regulator [Acrocarpospora catenulata]|uniref:MarR family winged helix-turn-helix transcriptional regulator n=1 Tax=Acrocarpospora catenulata TaxID=2836182 RepID=UPI001BD9480E|nr:MarR family winged helix-turn-helix transcriptional regulator [Acrocarpospora catenulata]